MKKIVEILHILIKCVRISQEIAEDREGWNTIRGAKVLIGEEGQIQQGMGGKFTGKTMSEVKRPQPTQPTQSENKPVVLSPQQQKAAAAAARVEGLNDNEKAAIEDYTKASYYSINKSLRGGSSVSNKTIDGLDSAFAKASTKEPITVYRGIRGDFADNLTVGTSFKDKGFASTSTERKTASAFAGKDDDGSSTVLQIRVPKGSKAISMEGEHAKRLNQKEIVLNRGGNYAVKEIIPGTRTRPKTIIVEYSDG